MEALMSIAKELGVEIKDNRNLGMGFHIVNHNTEYCLLSYNGEGKFYVNMGSRWFFDKKDADAFMKKFKALTELMEALNAKLKTETNKK
jgi:hypothetical protein